MMTEPLPPLTQLVQAVRHHADPLLAQLSPDNPDLASFRQALAALEQYAVTTEAPLEAGAPDRAGTEPPGAGSLRRAEDVALLVADHATFQQVLMDAPVGICILEGPEYRFTFSNPLYDQLAGRTQVVGKPLAEVFPELDGQPIYALLDGVMATGIPFVTPEILVQLDRDGDGVVEDIYYAFTYAPLRDATGQVIGVIDYATDISDRRALDQERVRVLQLTQAAQQAAEAERERLLAVLRQAPAAICVTAGPTHVFTFTNPRYEHLAGRTNLVGKTVHAALPEVAGQGFFALLDQVYATGVPVSGTEVPIQLQRDGQLDQAYVNFLYAPLRDATDTTVGLFVHAIEVTDLVVARQAAEAAVVLRDQFLSIAAHELRTPLTTMTGYIELVQRRLRRSGGIDARTDEMLTLLDGQSQRLSRLISTLTDVARINLGHLSLERTLLDVGALVRKMVNEVQVIAAPRTISLALPPVACLVLGDQLRLEQVVVNLVQNALKYSPNGGAVAVTVGCAPDQVWVQVQDQGLGIPAADLPHLFARFYRVTHGTSAALPGMGLGLAIVSEIVTLHGGTIRVASTEGIGSTFTVTLPRADAGAQASG